MWSGEEPVSKRKVDGPGSPVVTGVWGNVCLHHGRGPGSLLTLQFVLPCACAVTRRWSLTTLPVSLHPDRPGHGRLNHEAPQAQRM